MYFLFFIFFFRRQFFRSIIDVIDGIVVVVSFIVDMVFVALADSKSCQSNYARLVNSHYITPNIVISKERPK